MMTNEQLATQVVLKCEQCPRRHTDLAICDCYLKIAVLEMARKKDAEFEKLINGLPTPLKELIIAFKNYKPKPNE